MLFLKKKLSVIISIVLCCLVFASCTQSDNNGFEIAKGIPNYEENINELEMYTLAFGKPKILTQIQYDYLKECGINNLWIDGWSANTKPDQPELITALQYCENAGIKGVVYINNNHNLQENEFISVNTVNTDYSSYKAFDGYAVFDEPKGENLDWIAAEYDRYKQIYPDYPMHLNLMWHALISNQERWSFAGEYCQKVLSKVPENQRVIMYDRYALDFDLRNKVAYPNKLWLESLEGYAVTAKEYKADLRTFIQTVGYDYGAKRKPSSIEDIRYQNHVNMAYGSKGIAVFLYQSLDMAGYVDAMISSAGTRTDIYYYVQQAFNELLGWDHVYLSYDWQGTMIKKGYKPTNLQSDYYDSLKYTLNEHARIKSINTERDLLIGTFKDKDGYDGFMLTTFNDPYYQKFNNVTVEFKNASKCLLYLNGKKEIVNLEKGVLNYELAAGDGLFAIPLV